MRGCGLDVVHGVVDPFDRLFHPEGGEVLEVLTENGTGRPEGFSVGGADAADEQAAVGE